MMTPAASKTKKKPAATQPMFSAEKREVVAVPLDQIQVDPRQPRAKDPGKQANIDLIAPTLEIDEAGIAHPIQPIAIRKTPAWAESQGVPWMIFEGECRYLGALVNGAKAIDTVEIVMAEELVFECQMRTFARDGLGPAAQLEAIRRFDSDHPDVNAANAAVRLGMKTDVIRALRKVNALPAEVRLRFMGGDHTLEVCDAIGRIDGATPEEKVSRQEAASRAVVKMDAKKAREHILRTYLLRLKDAPFDREDASLVPAAGVCSACPHRTGAQASLFGATDTADDCCTRQDCWNDKAAETIARTPPPAPPEEKAKKPGKPTPEDVGIAAKLAAGAEAEELDALFPAKTRADIDAALERLEAHGNPKAGPALQDRRAKGQDIRGFSRGSAHAIASVAIAGVRDAMTRLSPADTAIFLRWVLESTGGFLTFIEAGAPTYDPGSAAISALRTAIDDIDPSALPSFLGSVRMLLADGQIACEPSGPPPPPPPVVGEDGMTEDERERLSVARQEANSAHDEFSGSEPPVDDFADAEDDWREVPE